MSVACVDENFAYAIASSANRTLKIVGVNPGKYNASNTNWGAFPPIKLVYAGPIAPYNGFGVSDNAYAIVEIADNAFNHSANQNPFTEGPLALTSNIVRIGANAFNSVKITGVLTIPSSVLHVGDQAFSNMLIDEIVFENETNSDLLGGVVDSTRVLSKNKAGRTAADTVLNTLKVTKANPTMTGVTTIPNAVISNATIINATVTTENVTTGTLVSASIANLVAGGAASFSGNVSVSGQWNYTVQPKYNTVGLATQSYVDSKISLIDGNTASLTSTMNTLNKIASAIGGDPNFGLHVSQSQSNISQSTAIDTLLRTSQIVSLSSSLSTATVSLQTVDASIAAGIGSGSTARGSQIGSLSSSLSSATVSLQTVDASIAAGIGSGSTARNSQIGSLSSTLSTLVSERQANDISISSGIASAVSRRSLDVGSTSTALVNGGATLQSTDASLSSGIVSASTGRSGAVSSVSVMLSSAVPSLQTMDNAFLNALGSHTSNRASEVTSLTTARTSHVSALQAVKSTILPQISGGGLNQDGRTSTVFNLLGINVGESLMCVMGSGTFATNDKITIIYSATDYLRGTVTGVSGSNVTFTVTSKATSAVETQIYSTTGSFGNSGVLNSGMGNYIAPISPTPSFTNSSNYVVTTMSASQLRSVSASASFYMNLLDGSNNILGSSAQSAYYSFPFDYWGVFKSAFVPRNSTLKQQFVFTGGINVRLSFDVAGAAYTTMKGYAVPYSFGVVQIELPGTAESARISAVNSLSAGVASMLTSQLTANTSISSAIFNASSARSSAITSLSTHASASVSSLQSVSTALSNTQSTAVSDRITNVASLSNALYGNMSSLTSVNVSNSNRLSTEIVNRSVQIINAVNSLVNGAPSALDTLFEIANALTTGPSMYSTISNTDAALTSNVNARSSQMASLSGALSSSTLSLQTVDASLLSINASNTSARSSQMASLSGALSSSTLSLQTVDASLLSTNASNTSARSSQIVSLSGALSSSTLSLQTVDASLLSTNASNTSARSSQIVSLSNSIVGFVSTQVSFSGSLSSAISDATSTRIREISSLSSSLSTLATTLTGADTSLGNAFTSLSNGTQLSTLANLTEVDASVAGIMGLSTISALDTLGKIASAINLQPDIGTVIVSMTNAKGDASTVSSISAAATSCATQFSLSQLADAAGLKVSVSTTTSLQSVISGLSTSFGTLQSEVNSLTSSTAINSVVTADMVKTTRDLDELYVKNGFVNPDGSINYKINHLADPVINPGSSPSLAFAIDGNHQITAIRQVAAVLFDSLQTTMKYTSRGVEFTTSSSAFTNRVYTFSIDSSSIADYTANATAIVVTGQETSLRLAPVNALTIPKLALSSYTYAAPTVQTPYAATTWNDATGKISQVLRFNFELGVQKLQIDGTTYDVAGTTEKVDTLEYYPGASGTFSVRALNSTSKLQSPALTLSNVYNDYPQYAAPVLVGGTKTITLSGSTCTYSATFSSDANVVEVHAYNSGTYSKVQDLTPATANQFSVSITYDVSRIGQPLFKLRAATSASKRASDFSTVVLCEAFTFPPAVISSNLTYTNLNTTPKSFSVSVIYAVHPMATVVQVINAGTGAVLVTPNPAVSNGSVAFTFNFTEAQAISGMSFYVKTNTNSVGLESSSAAQVVTSQYDVPVIVAGTKVLSASNLFLYSNPTTTFPYTLSNFPVLGSLSSWDMSVNFRSTGKEGFFRAIVGAHEYSPGARGWGLWINNNNRIHWTWLTWTINPDISTSIIVSTNVNYYLKITKTTTTIEFVLTNLDNSTMQSQTINHSNATIGTVGTVTMGGWIHNTYDNFVGIISNVDVGPYTYTYTANYTSASTTGVNVYDATGTTLLQTVTTPGSGTFTVTRTYDASKIGQTAFRLSSNAISTMRESALITVVGEDIPVHDAPTRAGDAIYGTSGSDHTAQLDYTAHHRVDNLTVLKSDLTPLPAAASFTQSILSTVGTTRTFRVMVTYSNAVAPLTIVVIGLTNTYGKQSAASATQTLLGQHAAPVISGTVSYTTVSEGSYTANMTYTVVSAVTAVQVRKASDGTVISGATASVSGTTATIAVPFTDATAPLNVVIVALANANGRESAVSASQTLLGQHAAPVIVAGTKVVMTSMISTPLFTISSSTSFPTRSYVQNAAMVLSNFPALDSLTQWKININFNAQTQNTWRPLIGSMYYINGSGKDWGVLISDTNKIYWTFNLNQFATNLSVSQNVNYQLTIARTTGNLTFVLKNADNSTSATFSNNFVEGGNNMTYSGHSVTLGGWSTSTSSQTEYGNGGGGGGEAMFFGTISLAQVTVDSAEYTHTANYTSASTSGIKVYDSTGTTLLQTVTTPGSGTFTVSATYDASKIGQTAFRLSSNSISTMRESALITVVGEDIPVHPAPLASGGITYGTSGSNYTAQLDYSVGYSAPRSVDELIVLKADGSVLSALPSGASYTQSILNTVTFTGNNDVIRFFRVIVTFTDAVSPLNIMVVAAANMYGKQSTEGTPYMLFSPHDAPLIVAGTKTITLSGSTYTYTANYTSASTAGIKVYDSAGTTLLQTVTTPGSGTFTVTATYDASKIGQTVFVLKSAASATRSESVSALTVVGEDIPTHVAPIIVADSLAINSTIPSIYATTSSMSFPSRTYVSNTATVLQNFPTIIGDTWSGWDIHVFFTPTGGQSSIRPIVGSYSYNPDGSGSDWRIYIAANNYIYWAWSGEEMLIGEAIGIITLNHSYYFRARKLNNSFYYEFTLVNITTNVMAFDQRTSYDPTFSPTVRVGTGNPVTVGQWKYNANQMFIGTISSVQVGSYNATMSYTVNYRVDALNILKSDGSALPANVTVQQSVVSTIGTSRVISVALGFLDLTAPSSIAVFAAANVYGKKSAASTAQTLTGQYAAPVLSGTVAYSGTGPYSASMTYTVASGVTAVSVLKSDLTALPAGASVTTNTVSGTTATLVVSFTDAVAPLGIVVVALANSVARQSPASASQTLLGLYAAPVISGTIAYSGTGPYSASMTYTVASGVTEVSVLKSDLNALPAGASVTTNTVSGTTATLVVSFTDAVAPLGIVVVALANSAGRQGPASASQTLLGLYAAPVLSGTVAYSGTGPYSASMTYTVASGVTAVSVLKSDLNALPAGASVTTNTVSGTTATLVVSFTDAVAPLGIVVFALANSVARQSPASASQTLSVPVPPPAIARAGTVSSGTLGTLSTFGSTGTGNGQFVSPAGIATDAAGNIYVVDKNNHRIIKFNSTGTHVSTIGGIRGSGNGHLEFPYGIAIDAAGNIHVTDSGNNRVQVFDNAGTYIRTFGGVGSTAQERLFTPRGIAIDAAGNIYVVSPSTSIGSNENIKVYSSTGIFIRMFGSHGGTDGRVAYPDGIAIDATGNIFVADSNNHRIQKFDSNGNYLAQFGSFGVDNGGQFSFPCGIAIDASGKIVVVDGSNRIQTFTNAGIFVNSFGSYVSYASPKLIGIAINASGQILVSDINNGDYRVQIIGPPPLPPAIQRAGTLPSGTLSTLSTFGSQGAGNGQFNIPYRIALDASGKIYVVDTNNHRIQIFNSAGTYVSKIGGVQGSGSGHFNYPYGIAIDASGKILVADSDNHRIQVFNSDGTYVSTIGSQGTANGRFNNPTGIAIDASGKILVADSFNNRIQIFTSAGMHVSTIGTGTAGNANGQFNYPKSIAIDASGKILVADSDNHRIQVFNSDGTYDTQFGTYGTTDNGNFRFPSEIAIDASGKILVADGSNHRIQLFTSAGIHVSTIGSQGTGNGQFQYPRGIAIDASGKILVADTNNHRVQIVGQ